MKNLTIRLVFFCMVMLVYACNQGEQSAEKSNLPSEKESGLTENQKTFRSSTMDTISLDTFRVWSANWKNHGATWLASDSLYAFNLPDIDLTEVLGERPDSARYYIGLESNEKGGYNAKLMLVGVKAGKDMINYNKGHYLYDLSTACPPFCH